MANTKSAKKEIRVAAARQERNKSIRSITKTVVHKAEVSVGKPGVESAAADLKSASSALDKAAQAGIMHANAASRKKGRLTRALNKTVKSK